MSGGRRASRLAAQVTSLPAPAVVRAGRAGVLPARPRTLAARPGMLAARVVAARPGMLAARVVALAALTALAAASTAQAQGSAPAPSEAPRPARPEAPADATGDATGEPPAGDPPPGEPTLGEVVPTEPSRGDLGAQPQPASEPQPTPETPPDGPGATPVPAGPPSPAAPGESVREASGALGAPHGVPAAPQAAADGAAREPEAPARYPGVAQRPLTLPEGMARIEQLIYYRFVAIPVPMHGVPMGLAVGVHDDVEVGVSWGVLDDPSIHVLGRWLHDRVIDVGASARLTVPAMTNGDTLLRVAVPVAIRPIEWMRVDTGLAVELLFRAQVSPLATIPLTLTFAPLETFFFGAMGSAGWLDGNDWVADAGAFVGWSARNQHGVIADGRIAAQWFGPGDDVVISLGLRFFPRFWR